MFILIKFSQTGDRRVSAESLRTRTAERTLMASLAVVRDLHPIPELPNTAGSGESFKSPEHQPQDSGRIRIVTVARSRQSSGQSNAEQVGLRIRPPGDTRRLNAYSRLMYFSPASCGQPRIRVHHSRRSSPSRSRRSRRRHRQYIKKRGLRYPQKTGFTRILTRSTSK